MKNLILVFIPILVFTISCSDNLTNNSVEITLKNSSGLQLVDEYVEIDLNKLNIGQNIDGLQFMVHVDDTEIACQRIENNKLGFVVDFQPNEEKIAAIKYGDQLQRANYKNRTYAEISRKVDYEKIDGKYVGGRFQNFQKLSVPLDHTDHNALFRYEGPGWESEKVGYRMYIDWRNRTDIFGKKTNDLVLKNVGINDIEAKNDSYHNMQEWGKDIFKVGNTFGVGSFGMMADDKAIMVSNRDSVTVEVTDNGPVKSNIKVNYYGWKVNETKYDLEADLSITAGSRLTKVNLNADNNPDNFVTGLAMHPGTNFHKKINENGWSYISVYGVQTIADYGQPDEPVDKLGVAVIFNNNDLIEQSETEDSFIVILKPNNGKLKYYFAAAWEKEPNGIKTEQQFYNYLDDMVESLNNPIILKY